MRPSLATVAADAPVPHFHLTGRERDVTLRTMKAEEHVQTALAFLEASDREFEAGDDLQASEKLWGAATHALRAAAMPQGQPTGSNRDLRLAAKWLASQRSDPAILLGFKAAERFRTNYCHGFMEEDEIADGRQEVHGLVERLLPVRPPSPPQDALPPATLREPDPE